MKLEVGKTHKHYKDLPFPCLTWDEVFWNIDQNVCAGSVIEEQQNYGLITHNAHLIKKTQPILELVKQADPTREWTAYMHLSLCTKSFTLGKHKDQADVWFWQTIGKTRWIVFDQEIHVYELSPGEMLYIPHGMYHDTKPLTPRVGISFGLEAVDRIPDDEWLAQSRAGI